MKSEAMTNPDECVKKLGEMIQDVKVAMLTTIDEQGYLHSRPMMSLESDFDGDLYFFTSRTSGKVLSISHDDRVNLAYSDVKTSKFVSVAGRAEMIHDAAKMKELWKPAYKAWFPEGLDDPDLALLKVTVESAEYWDPVSSNLVQIAGFAKALLTGKRFEGTDNERFSLRH